MKGDDHVTLIERIDYVENSIEAALFQLNMLNERHPSREGSLVRTKLQEAMFWVDQVEVPRDEE